MIASRASRRAAILFPAILLLAMALLTGACAAGPETRSGSGVPGDSYARVDAFALSAPHDAAGSVESLSAYLSKAGGSDADKARVIFRWIAANVKYDPEGIPALRSEDQTPAAVLRTGKAVCEGYSSLFEGLARAAGLEAVTISGYAKGMRYRAGDRFSGPPDHAWNAVKIAGAWRLVDCTWGAGAMDVSGVYRERFEPFYFLTAPDRFLFTHYPLDPRWQLVDKPITLEEFEEMPYLKEPFFKAGMRLLSHPSCVIETPRRSLAVEIGTPEDCVLHVKLYRDEQASAVPCVRRNDREVLQVVFPSSGEYVLRVFVASKPPSLGILEYEWALDYKILVTGNGKER